ncbi:transposable element Tcb1 transposase [Trichonephila clavipes]|nr:transposable element Tcb1 transposase [Trichonephila clavipes]
MSHRKQRSAFDQVSDFNRGRIVAYTEIMDYLSGKLVVVLEKTKQMLCGYVTVGCRRVRRTDVLGRIHLSAPLHQRGLSARRPLLGLPLTQNHRRLRHQWCDERRMWVTEWNEIVFTDESRICLQHRDGRIRVWRHRGERMLNSCVVHRYTGPAPDIMVRGGIGYHSRTTLVRIACTLNSQRSISDVLEAVVLPYLRCWPQPYFNRIMRDHTWHALSKGSSSITRLNCFPGRLALRIFHP